MVTNMTKNFSLKALVGLSDVLSNNLDKNGKLFEWLTDRLADWQTNRLID